MLTGPTPREVDDALAVVHSPDLVANHPALRLDAWQILMAERGRRVNIVRVSAMQNTLRDMRGLACHLLNPAVAQRPTMPPPVVTPNCG